MMGRNPKNIQISFIARNPNNHKDKWLVAAAYANDNFKLKE